MSDTPKTPASAIASHGRDLQKVTEQLKHLVASLRTEKEKLENDARQHGRGAAPPPPAPEPGAPDEAQLAAELALAREAIAHANDERERLRARLAEIEAENQRVCDEYVAIQERSTELAQLYVALERIHGGVSRAETLSALQEIVINVVGSEELAVFERRGDRLVLVQSFGIDPEPWREVPADRGAIGAAAAGRLWVAGRDGEGAPGEEDLTACVPLRVRDEIVGVVAVFRLLGHKPVLGEGDQALFELIASHAGLALHLRAPRDRAA